MASRRSVARGWVTTPWRGAIYVFRNRAGPPSSCCSYDGQGYWLLMKRLSQGRFTWWPQSPDARVPLSARELIIVLWNGHPEARPDGPRLAARGLRRRPAAGIGPGEPCGWLRKHLATVLLQCHQVLHRIDTRIKAGGNQTGEHAGDVTMRAL